MKLWSLGGGPSSPAYRAFDAARNILNRNLARYLQRYLPRDRPGAVRTLEPGSGPGFCSSLLGAVPGGPSVTILDLDAEVLALATARDGHLAAVQGDLYCLPFRDGVFDLVFNSSTLEHLGSFGRALSEMARVTRRGGRLFVGVPYRYGPFLPFTLVPPAHPVSVWMGKLHSRGELRAACEACGLHVEEVRLYFFGCFLGALLRKVSDPSAMPRGEAR